MKPRIFTQQHGLAAVVLAAILLCGLAAGRADPQLSVDQIVDNALRVNYYQGRDGRARVAMTIIDEQNRERNREFTILRRDNQPDNQDASDDQFLGDQKFYVYFHRPADVRKMVFMVWKHVESDDDRWLYLPSLDLVKRIASSEERTSFVGSHFFYEDVSGRNKTEDNHELADTTENYYVLKSTPKKPELVEFAYYKMWIHRDSFVVTQTEYYDEQDQKYREYKVLKVEHIQDYPTVVKSQMKDHRLGGHSVIEYTDVRYNVGLPEDVFTERYLRRPPIQYLRE
jgi:outer membrane lipoprotein-sorting protein